MKNLETPTFKGKSEEELSMDTTEQKKLEREQRMLPEGMLWMLKQGMGGGAGRGGGIKREGRSCQELRGLSIELGLT